MLSKFTIQKISEEPNAFNDIIWYYEGILGYEFNNTDEISKLIDKAYVEGTIIYTSEINNFNNIVKVINEHLGTNYKTANEIDENESIDLICGDEIYAIIW